MKTATQGLTNSSQRMHMPPLTFGLVVSILDQPRLLDNLLLRFVIRWLLERLTLLHLLGLVLGVVEHIQVVRSKQNSEMSGEKLEYKSYC